MLMELGVRRGAQADFASYMKFGLIFCKQDQLDLIGSLYFDRLELPVLRQQQTDQLHTEYETYYVCMTMRIKLQG